MFQMNPTSHAEKVGYICSLGLFSYVFSGGTHCSFDAGQAQDPDDPGQDDPSELPISLVSVIGRKAAVSDDELLARMALLYGIKSVAGFQAAGRDSQAKALAGLREKGASLRQLARLSGLGRAVVTRMCRDAPAT